MTSSNGFSTNSNAEMIKRAQLCWPPPTTATCSATAACSTRAASWRVRSGCRSFTDRRAAPQAGTGIQSKRPLTAHRPTARSPAELAGGRHASDPAALGPPATRCRGRVWRGALVHPRSAQTVPGCQRSTALGDTPRQRSRRTTQPIRALNQSQPRWMRLIGMGWSRKMRRSTGALDLEEPHQCVSGAWTRDCADAIPPRCGNDPHRC